MDIPVLGNSTLADASVLSNVANEVEGWYTTAEYNSNDPREYVQNFNEEFIAEYGYAPDVSAALQYDIVNLLKAACEAGGSATDRAKINEGFTKIENLECLIGIASYHDDIALWVLLILVKLRMVLLNSLILSASVEI